MNIMNLWIIFEFDGWRCCWEHVPVISNLWLIVQSTSNFTSSVVLLVIVPVIVISLVILVAGEVILVR